MTQLPEAGTTVSSGYARHCSACNKDMGDNEPDACWGYLPGVRFACCGHGDPSKFYIYFEDGTWVGFDPINKKDIRVERIDSNTKGWRNMMTPEEEYIDTYPADEDDDEETSLVGTYSVMDCE